MYYHIRLDKILHTGTADMSARQEWDFRSLLQGGVGKKMIFQRTCN